MIYCKCFFSHPVSYAHLHPSYFFLNRKMSGSAFAVRDNRRLIYTFSSSTPEKSPLDSATSMSMYPKNFTFFLFVEYTQPTRLASFKALLSLLGGLEALLLSGEKSVDGSVELVAAVEEVELHHEEEADQVTSELADERTGSGGGSTCHVELAD
jgi:hypothetical protein